MLQSRCAVASSEFNVQWPNSKLSVPLAAQCENRVSPGSHLVAPDRFLVHLDVQIGKVPSALETLGFMSALAFRVVLSSCDAAVCGRP